MQKNYRRRQLLKRGVHSIFKSLVKAGAVPKASLLAWASRLMFLNRARHKMHFNASQVSTAGPCSSERGRASCVIVD